MPSAKVAITASTSRSRFRCRRFRGADIRHGDFLLQSASKIRSNTIEGRQTTANLVGKVQTLPLLALDAVFQKQQQGSPRFFSRVEVVIFDPTFSDLITLDIRNPPLFICHL